MHKTPAVVMPLDEHMGLDIGRSLGEKGIPVYGIDPNSKAVGRSSRYIELVVSPEPIADRIGFLEFVVEWASALPERPVLFPLSDEMVQLCSLEWERLLQRFVYVMPRHDALTRLQAKQGLSEVAEQCGVPAPATYAPQGFGEVEALCHRIHLSRRTETHRGLLLAQNRNSFSYPRLSNQREDKGHLLLG